MKNRGLSIIELLVVLTLFAIVLTIAVPQFLGHTGGTASYSRGVNGVAEERCISGYKFVIGQRGQPAQILDQSGKGVACQ